MTTTFTSYFRHVMMKNAFAILRRRLSHNTQRLYSSQQCLSHAPLQHDCSRKQLTRKLQATTRNS